MKLNYFLRLLFLTWIASTFCFCFLYGQKNPLPQLVFLGQQIFPPDTTTQNVRMGGFSGITYNEKLDEYYVISDDQSEYGPARYYTLKIDIMNGANQPKLNKVTIDGWTPLTMNGKPFAKYGIDPEGIAFYKDSMLFVCSEGINKPKDNIFIAPFVDEFTLNGGFLNKLPVPDKFIAHGKPDRGIRQNLGFENLGITPDKKCLFAMNEDAIVQDGAPANLKKGSNCRLISFSLPDENVTGEYLYISDSVAQVPDPTNGFFVNGPVDILPLSNSKLWVLERSFSLGKGCIVKIYEIDLRKATDIRKFEFKDGIVPAKVRPVSKRLIATLNDFTQLPAAGQPGVRNIEGITRGPRYAIPNSKEFWQTIVLVSDNNLGNNSSPADGNNTSQVFVLGYKTK